MPTLVEMPRLSDTMREGTLARWLKALGDEVRAGDELAEIETDKAVQVFESFDDGVLLAQLIGEGDTVPLGTAIAILGEAGEDVSALAAELAAKRHAPPGPEASPAPTPPPPPAPPRVPAGSPPPRAAAPATTPRAAPAATPKAAKSLVPPAPMDPDGHRVRASPLARRLAAERGVDLRQIPGTGPRGRIVAADVESFDPPRRLATPHAALVGAAPSPPDTQVRVTQMRKTIARRLVESKQAAPHFYLTRTLDADALVALRADVNATQDRVKVSYNDLILRACALALAAHPSVNSGWEETHIRRFGGVHLGVAVALPDGLLTPVVRDAQRLGVLDIAAEVRALAARAREGALDPEEYTGATFTVSNLGMMGVERFTAIINPPGAAILAVGTVREAPVVRRGELAVGRVLSLTLSCDHRVIDGAQGAAFLAELVSLLEDPMRLVLR